MAQPRVSQEKTEEVLDLGKFIPAEGEETKAVEEGEAIYDLEDGEDQGGLFKVPYWQILYSHPYLGKRGGGVLGRITKRKEKGCGEKRRFAVSAIANRFMLRGFMRNPAFSFWSAKINRKDEMSGKGVGKIGAGGQTVQCGNLQCNEIVLATAKEPVWYSLPRGKKSSKMDWTRISKRGRETEGSWHPYKRDPIFR